MLVKLTRGAPDSSSTLARLRETSPWAAAGLAAAAFVPLAADAVRLDWLLPPLVWLLTATLLRSGRTVLDRLVLSGVLLVGLTCLLGAALSVWPWGLDPVAIATGALALLTIFSWLSGRRPRLPTAWRPADVALVVGALGVAAVTLWPLLRRDPAGRLALFMHFEDFSRHMNMYDTIRIVGGYLFLHRDAAAPHLAGVDFLTYPQGSHLVYAIGENFLVSATSPSSGVAWADHFLWWHAAGFISLCAVILWAVRWVAGPVANSLLGAGVLAALAGYLALGDVLTIYYSGYPQEIVALIFVTALVAIVLRPLPRTGEQLLFVAVLLAGVSFCYYFFLPVAAVASGLWLLRYRRRWRRRWIPSLLAGSVACLAAVPPYLNHRIADPSQTVLYGGQALRPRMPLIEAIVVVAALALLVLAARRSSVGLLGCGWLAAAGVFSYALLQYGQSRGGAPYFYYKSVHLLLIVALVCLGAAVVSLSRLVRAAAAYRWRWVAAVTAAACLAALGVAVTGAGTRLIWPGYAYLTGRTSENPAAAHNALDVSVRYPQPDGRATIVLLDGCWPDFLATIYAGILKHDFAPAYLAAKPMRPWAGPEQPGVVQSLRSSPYPLRVVVHDDDSRLPRLREAADERPSGLVEIVTVAPDPASPTAVAHCRS